MGWLPQAIKRDVGAPWNFSNGRMHSYSGVVLHVNAANSGDLYGWITETRSMSCHFQVLKNGTIYQYIDTLYSSWCQENGNDDWLSIETSGFPNEPLTEAALESCAIIMAFANKEHGILLQEANSISERGFGWHGMGGDAWGNHPSCPGEIRKAQRKDILNRAAKLIHPAEDSDLEEEDDMIRGTVTITTHPSTKRKRVWITGTKGIFELEASKEIPNPEVVGRALADFWGVTPIEKSEITAAQALPNNAAVVRAFR